MPPRYFWLLVLPLVALQPALSQAAGQALPFADGTMGTELQQAGALARHATEELLHAFETLRNAIPEFGAPYLDAHGNIVIPRHAPPAPPDGAPVTA